MKLDSTVIRRLAELSQNERSILSVYLDLGEGWKAAESFAADRAKRLRGALDADEEEHLDVALELLREELAKLEAEGLDAPGLAMFISLEEGLQLSVELPAAPQPQLAIDREAMVFPLALQHDEYETVGLILVDASGARIMIAAGEVSEELDSLRARIRHLSKVGGWSQMRYQRRRQKQVEAVAKEVAEAARSAFAEHGIDRVIVAGRQRMMTALEKALPRSLADKVIGRIAWDLDAEDDALLEELRPLFEEAERQQEEELLDRLRGELRRGGLAVVGADATRKALEWGAVDVLLIGPECEGEVQEGSLKKASTTGADIEFVPAGDELLARHEGVGALLRFPVDR
jgi:peptide chain release factor subunit 1